MHIVKVAIKVLPAAFTADAERLALLEHLTSDADRLSIR
jgi:hypothetical protein